MLKKRGQKTGSHAAALIGIITLVLMAYILFLPPEEREALLEDEELENGENGDAEDINKTLFEVSQLRLAYVGESEFEHNIPNINLKQTTSAKEFAGETPFYVRNGWFDKKEKTIEFELDDPENTMNLLVSLEAPKRKGRLMIYFNDELIYDYEATKLNIGPIEVKDSLLKEKNEVRLEVSGVGLAFWRTNEYAVEEFRVIGDITDVRAQESLNSFVVSNEEMYNFESGYLKFWPVCDPKTVGRLDVTLNSRLVYSAVPDCNSINLQDIFATDLNAGKNTIVFKTDRGNYRIEQIKVKTKLKDVKTFLEYFEVNETEYDDVRKNRRDAVLYIEFVDDNENKKADVNVNGHLARIDQAGPDYEKEISAWVEEGSRNYVEISPRTTLNIVEVKVMINEK
jgi:hypothetical protein